MPVRTSYLELIKRYLSPVCAFCRMDRDRRESWICYPCRRQLKPLSIHACIRCGAPFDEASRLAHACGRCEAVPPPFVRARSLFVYDGLLRERILAYKYGAALEVESALQELVAGGAPFVGDGLPIAAIVPVPPDPKRGRARGYNPPLRLALRLAQELDVPVIWRGLGRRATPSQTGLSIAERTENVHTAFALRAPERLAAFKGKPVLVIDDVWTTGATVRAFSQFLKDKAGVGDIAVLTLARR